MTVQGLVSNNSAEFGRFKKQVVDDCLLRMSKRLAKEAEQIKKGAEEELILIRKKEDGLTELITKAKSKTDEAERQIQKYQRETSANISRANSLANAAFSDTKREVNLATQSVMQLMENSKGKMDSKSAKLLLSKKLGGIMMNLPKSVLDLIATAQVQCLKIQGKIDTMKGFVEKVNNLDGELFKNTLDGIKFQKLARNTGDLPIMNLSTEMTKPIFSNEDFSFLTTKTRQKNLMEDIFNTVANNDSSNTELKKVSLRGFDAVKSINKVQKQNAQQ